jgi:hypothetical protein
VVLLATPRSEGELLAALSAPAHVAQGQADELGVRHQIAPQEKPRLLRQAEGLLQSEALQCERGARRVTALASPLGAGTIAQRRKL